MKHIHYLLLSVLLAFSSCQNNEETVPVAIRGYYVDYQWYLRRRGNSGFIPYFV